MSETSDIGYLKRVDRGNGESELVDGFGKVVAVVQTSAFPEWSKNMRVVRYRVSSPNTATIDLSDLFNLNDLGEEPEA